MNHQSTRSLEFGALPLVEAAVRASLGAPQGVTYSLINSIAAELDPTFPQVEEPKQIEIPPGAAGQFTFGPGQLPGAVFTGNDAGLTVSVHPQVIIARWAKHPRFPEREYPRYGPLREWLWRTVEAVRHGSGDEPVDVTVVNMSYVNFVASPDPSAFLKNYFSGYIRVSQRA